MAASLAGLVRQATTSIGNRAKEAKEAIGWEPYPEPANLSLPPRGQAASPPPAIPPRVQATI